MTAPVQNPLWPVIDYSLALSGSALNTGPFYWMSLNERLEGAVSTTRGQQYALDKMQTGTWQGTARNDDGALTPGNASSPYFPQIQLYRHLRMRAQFPASINILQPNQANCVAPAGSLPAFTAGSFFQGNGAADVLSASIPSGTAAGTILLEWWDFPIAPALPGDGTPIPTTYAFQLKAAVNVTMSLRVDIGWKDATGATISTTHGTPVSVVGGAGAALLTVIGSPPANCAGGLLEFVLNTTNASTTACNVIQVQLEQSSSASAFANPGTWYDLWRGFVDTWPQDWNADGTYGISNLQAADAYSIISSRNIKSPGYAEILNLNPTFFFPMDEPAGATGFQDATNTVNQIAFAQSGHAIGYTAEAGATLAGSNHNGISGPVAQIDQPGTGTNKIYLQIASASNPNAFLPGAGGPGFTRLWAVNPSVDPTGAANPDLWNYIDQQIGNLGAVAPDFQVFMGTQPLSSGGQPYINITIANVLILSTTLAGPAVVDGNMHVIALTCDSTGKNLVVYVDGIANTFTLSADMRFRGPQMSDVLCPPSTADSAQYSCIAQWTGTVLTAAQIANISNTILGGGSLDGSLGSNGLHLRTSATRYADILRWLNWSGPSAIDSWASGETVNYGPPSEFLNTINATGTDGLSALQTVIDTENGRHFAAGNGAVTMQARRNRYNVTSQATFGEDPAGTGAEIPYVSGSWLFDSARVVTDAQMTQTSTQQVYTTLAANVADPNGPGNIPLQRNINTTLTPELTDAGQFITQNYSTVQNRIETIVVPLSSYTDSSNNPSTLAWATVLPLELGDLVTVMRRPPNAAAYTFLGFLEQINFNIDDQLNAYATLQVSPAPQIAAWELSAFHVAQASSIAAGSTAINLPALPDAATNSPQSNIVADPANATMAVDWGTSVAEFASITAVTPASPGYTTLSLALGNCIDAATGAQGTGLRHAHAAGAIWQDIGGWLNAPGHNNTKLSAAIVPVNALDPYDSLGTTTILTY